MFSKKLDFDMFDDLQQGASPSQDSPKLAPPWVNPNSSLVSYKDPRYLIELIDSILRKSEDNELKTNLGKFKCKVVAFNTISGVTSCFKVKLYKNTSKTVTNLKTNGKEQIIIEFHRYNGDSFLFWNIFKKVAIFMADIVRTYNTGSMINLDPRPFWAMPLPMDDDNITPEYNDNNDNVTILLILVMSDYLDVIRQALLELVYLVKSENVVIKIKKAIMKACFFNLEEHKDEDIIRYSAMIIAVLSSDCAAPENLQSFFQVLKIPSTMKNVFTKRFIATAIRNFVKNGAVLSDDQLETLDKYRFEVNMHRVRWSILSRQK